ncbi:MAG TPA: hypothetical protein VII58_05710 [Acidobacteriaceae bacterium]
MASNATATDFNRYATPNSTSALNGNLNTGQITSTVGGTSAPGIAYGKPFNVQLALRIMF